MKSSAARKFVHSGILLTLLGFVFYANGSFQFTNIICNPIDKESMKFQYCYLKSYNRTYKYLSLRITLLRPQPMNNIFIRLALFKRANGYKPFLYNITFDACKFHKARKSNAIAAYIYTLFVSYSNINHTCPYSGDVIVEKLDSAFLNDKTTNVLPVPRGKYCLHIDVLSYGVLRSNLKIFGELT